MGSHTRSESENYGQLNSTERSMVYFLIVMALPDCDDEKKLQGTLHIPNNSPHSAIAQHLTCIILRSSTKIEFLNILHTST